MKFDHQNQCIDLGSPPDKVTKKLTGTRLGTILGLNPWSSPFEVWCDVTGTYKKPFEGNMYTMAGETIEPKVIAWLDKSYYYGQNKLKNPEQWYRKTKQQMKFDHFPDDPLFGGMWDARTEDAVYELKTTKRAEDWWQDGQFDAPEYYKLQAALYAHLLHLDKFVMVVTFLNDEDYEHPELFVPSTKNTQTITYWVSKEYPNFQGILDVARDWWSKYVLTGISPPWSASKVDKEILDAITTSTTNASDSNTPSDITQLMAQIEQLETEISSVAAQESALKKLKERLKEVMSSLLSETDEKSVLVGKDYKAELKRSVSTTIDRDALERDGLLTKYSATRPSLTLSIKKI